MRRAADLTSAAERLKKALEHLAEAWNEVSEQWDDANARAFAENHLEPLAAAVRSAMDAVNRMNEVIGRAERESSDPL